MIDVIFVPNTGGVNPTGFHAITVQSENRTNADFVRTMTSLRGNVTEGDCAQWLDLVKRSVIFELSQGRAVNIEGFINANVHVKGEFPASDSPFDPSRNTIHGSINFCRSLNKALAGSPVHHVSDAASGLYIEHIHDLCSGTEDYRLTRSYGIRMRGNKMKLAGTGSGLWLLDEVNNAHLVDPSLIIRNGPKEIEFICPLVPDGDYRLMVTTMYSGSSTLLKEARSYIFPIFLTVV